LHFRLIIGLAQFLQLSVEACYRATVYLITRFIPPDTMSMSPLRFLRPKLALLDCKSGNRAEVLDFPAWIGGKGADLAVDDSDNALIEFGLKGGSPFLRVVANFAASVNGDHTDTERALTANNDYAILIGDHLVLGCWTRNVGKWFAERSQNSWQIVGSDSQVLAGPAPLAALGNMAPSAFADHPKAVLHQISCGTGFFLKDVASALGWGLTAPQKITEAAHPAPVEPPKPIVRAPRQEVELPPDIDSDSGEFTCPVCWIRFDRGDVLHVATHESLKGDPVLGEEHMLRFTATRFNNAGQALDAMGIAAAELACPHCRRALPPSFLDLKQHIVSIVGAPSSGKSYYLSVLIKMLQSSLFTKFQSAFYDADPKENVRLTEMKNKLFSTASPEEASIAKTDLEGDMYVPVSRMGRKVMMPRPFIFNIAPPEGKQEPCAVVLYDNAGEHFEPTRDSTASPGAQHVAAAAGILFLFDPTYNVEFRRRLSPQKDPQLNDQRFDQQDTILAEMNARVKKLRGIDFRQRMDTPLAVTVGKSDVWGDLLGAEAFADPLSGSGLDLDLVEQNSAKVRQLLYEIVPSVVANAEMISSRVMYFPVSAFGCSPEELSPDPKTGRRRFSPDPHKINPRLVEIPMLWLLTQFEPGLLTTKRES